ncbi:MAG: hypothetical protein HY722_13650 [Planctomycetes bacterium]|nr:hypothetical protein [Planctomycetota bacterium]
MGRVKVTVVGAGFVGATAAQRLAEDQVGDVVLTDVVEHIAEGKALDLWEAAPVLGYDSRTTGVTVPKEGPWPDSALEKVAGSAAVVITAGIPRKPGMSRSDLL